MECFNCKEEASIACDQCIWSGYYCKACFGKFHSKGAFSKHKSMDLAESLLYTQKLLGSLSDKDFDDKVTSDDENVLVEYNVEENNISVGPKFGTLKSIEQEDNMPVVTFIGPTGVGKSSLIHFFCEKGGPTPIPAAPGTQVSTSSDINAYVGRKRSNNDTNNNNNNNDSCDNINNNEKRNSKVLILDSEGVNGSNTCSEVLSRRNRLLPQCFLPHHQYRKAELDVVRRSRVVNNVYPRILYLVSNVICFVFSGSPKEVGTIYGMLEKYSASCARATVNLRRKPDLVIIFNKVPAHEGEWDIQTATQQWKQSNPSMNKLNEFFESVHVVHLPLFSSGQLAFFSSKVDSMREMVFNLAEASEPPRKCDVLRLLSRTVSLFKQNPDCKMDLVELALLFSPIPGDIPAYLIEFFHASRKKLEEEGQGKHAAFKGATECLAKYAAFALHLHMSRQNEASIQLDKATLLTKIRPMLDKVGEMINKWVPCSATHVFNGKTTSCCNVQATHTGYHQSAEIQIGKRVDISFPLPDKNACGWEGDFQPIHFEGFQKMVEQHAQVHDSTSKQAVMQMRRMWHEQYCDLLCVIETTRVCLGCLMALPSMTLSCHHYLCTACISEFTKEGHTTCPLCKKQNEVNVVEVPKNTGFRVLSMDGGGVRGIATIAIMQRIQDTLSKHIDMELLDGFDYIIGTSAGGITALGLAAKRLPLQHIKELAMKIGKEAFKGNLRTYFRSLFAGSYYPREPLHNVLYSVLGDTPMFGCTYSPKIATVACTMDEGACKPVLFASYTRPEVEGLMLQDKGTLTDAAEATSAASTYFPVFEKPYGSFIDGGIICNNPCEIGYEEACRLWPEKQCDFVLSLGTGKCVDRKKRLSSDILSTIMLLKENATDPEKHYSNLCIVKQLDGRRVRITPTLDKDYALWDHRKTSDILKTVESINQKAIDEASSFIYACSFYLKPDLDSLEEGRVQFIGTITSRLTGKGRDALHRASFVANSCDKELEISQALEVKLSPESFNNSKSFIISVKVRSPFDNTLHHISGSPYTFWRKNGTQMATQCL